MRLFQVLFLLFVSFFILYHLAGEVDVRRVLARLEKTHFRWICLAAGVNILCFFVRSLRWRLMFHATDVPVGRIFCFHAVVIGAFANLFSPKVGDLFRCISMQRMKKMPLSFLLGSVVAERLVDVLCLFVLCTLIFFSHYQLFVTAYQEHWRQLVVDDVYVYAVLGVGLLVALGLYLLRRKAAPRAFGAGVTSFVRGLSDGFLSLGKAPNPLRYVLLTLLLWTLYYFSIHVALLAVDETATLGLSGALITLTMSGLGSVIPLPASLGSYHALVMFGLMSSGISHEVALFSALLMHSFNVFSVLSVGMLSLGFFFWYLSRQSRLAAG